MLVVGSVAMWRLLGDDLGREPKDLDVFARPNDPALAWASPDDIFWHDDLAGTQLDIGGYANLNQMYTIKVSHSYWEIGNTWQKHMMDILNLKRHGAVLDMELHKLLYPIWQEKHGKKKMNLAQAAGDFFDDAVVRIYDHDSIHDSCAFGDKPLYERILKDGETVDIDPDKMWNGLTFEEQVLLFREEIAATALERWMIPTNYRFSPGRAYAQALRKTIVSLTKGRSARFIVDNFDQFYKPHDYMKIHVAKKNLLRPLDKNAKGMM
jgi:hypothetical protein